jgi:hypothetical protein
MHQKTEQKRAELIAEMRQIDRLRQGTLSEQYYGTGENRQGPYYVLQGYADGKHWSKRIPRDQVEQVKADLEAGARFKDLCQQFADATEEATRMEDPPARKKNSAKRKRNATAKPKRS